MENSIPEEMNPEKEKPLPRKMPTDEWIRHVEAQKAASPVNVTAEEILKARDMDRT